jgi:DNA-binding response OmpR family regulator
MAKILIVDDEKDIVDALKIYLFREDYELFEAYDGYQAIEVAKREDVDLILMDIMMPKMDGIRATHELRKFTNVPILFLSAKSEDADKILGLDIGADDYITKPFRMDVVVLRIEAILRRVRGKSNKAETIRPIGIYTFDTQKQILTADDKIIKLTTKEAELLTLLSNKPNELLPRDYALKSIWIDDNYFNARSMDVYITKLRKHLKGDPNVEILNVHGKGYKLVVSQQPQ